MKTSSEGNRQRQSTVIIDSVDNEQYYREEFPNLISILKSGADKACTTSTLRNRLPILKWIPDYKFAYLLSDLIAGLTVGLTAIPQGIAYGVVSGLGPHYGLYAAFMGSFVYILFGTCKAITIGPTAIMALMVQKYVQISPDFAILACFLAGCVITIFGLLHFGFIIEFISTPVTIGFTTAAAISIASGQLPAFLGIQSQSNDFVTSWVSVITNIKEVKLSDSGLGLATIALLIILQKCTNLPNNWKLFGKYLSLSRNALAVIIGSTIAYLFSLYDLHPFRLTGKIQSGIPPFQMPPFRTETINGTALSATDMLSTLGSSIIAIPIVSILDTVAIANTLSKGTTVDASQEMIALGLCNVASSFFSSMPITGSFTRSAVNSASGVMTPLGGFFTGALILLGLGVLTESFYYIPKSVLAAMIIVAMFYMIHFDKIANIFRTKRMDMLPFLTTVLTSLYFGLEVGIVCGVSVNVLYILYYSARPDILIEARKIDGNDILLVKLSQHMFFPSADYLRKRIASTIADIESSSIYVVIGGDFVKTIDSTVAMHLKTLRDDLKSLGYEVIFWNWRKCTAGVLWRLSKDFESHFLSGSDFNEPIKELFKRKDDNNPRSSQTYYFSN